MKTFDYFLFFAKLESETLLLFKVVFWYKHADFPQLPPLSPSIFPNRKRGGERIECWLNEKNTSKDNHKTRNKRQKTNELKTKKRKTNIAFEKFRIFFWFLSLCLSSFVNETRTFNFDFSLDSQSNGTFSLCLRLCFSSSLSFLVFSRFSSILNPRDAFSETSKYLLSNDDERREKKSKSSLANN